MFGGYRNVRAVSTGPIQCLMVLYGPLASSRVKNDAVVRLRRHLRITLLFRRPLQEIYSADNEPGHLFKAPINVGCE